MEIAEDEVGRPMTQSQDGLGRKIKALDTRRVSAVTKTQQFTEKSG